MCTPFSSGNNLHQDNFLRFDLYFSTSQQTLVKEDKLYPNIYSLFSSLGGALSLWMGLSFVIVVEAIEVGIDLFAIVCVGNRRRNSTS